ncbi:MAG: hypothetical protein IPN79_20005 [Saprospiraceae bacterium]|nr:hypothetical protein [Saprospiraceae bacterium]
MGRERPWAQYFDKKRKILPDFHDAKNPNSLSGNKVEEQITELADGRFWSIHLMLF